MSLGQGPYVPAFISLPRVYQVRPSACDCPPVKRVVRELQEGRPAGGHSGWRNAFQFPTRVQIHVLIMTGEQADERENAMRVFPGKWHAC